MEEEDQQETQKYSLYLEKAKTLYLLNRISYEENLKNKRFNKENSCLGGSSIVKEEEQGRREYRAYEHQLKIGEQTCHQFFDSSLRKDIKYQEVC
jgi:hypothetical protein